MKAAIRRGGTARAARGGMRTEDNERSSRTVVVWIFTLLFVVVIDVGEGWLGSGRWRDLALSSISGLSDRAWSVW